MRIDIRPAQAADFSQVEELMRLELQLHAAHCPGLFHADGSGYSREEFDALLVDPNAIALIAETEGTVAGLCFGKASDRPGDSVFQPGRDAELDDLVVSPAFRRQGIARALLLRAKERAAALGAGRLGLRVWQFNEGALALYRSLGMTAQWSKLEVEL